MRDRYKNCISTVTGLAGLLAAVSIAGGCGGGRSAGTSDQPAAVALAEPPASPPAPDIAVDVNSESDLTIYQGTPLLVTVRLGNQRASNVLSRLAAQAKPATNEQASVVHLSANWPKLVRFILRTDRGAEVLGWTLAPINGQEAQPVALDGRTNPEAHWGLGPEAAASVAPGIYRLVAVLEAASKDSAIWQGRVESEPVVLTIQARPGNLQGSRAAESDINLAYYWAQTGDWEKSLAAARKAAVSDPTSVEGYTLIGDALVARNQTDAALAAYTAALRLYEQNYKESLKGKTEEEKKYQPKEYQPPDYLLRRILLIQKAKLPK